MFWLLGPNHMLLNILHTRILPGWGNSQNIAGFHYCFGKHPEYCQIPLFLGNNQNNVRFHNFWGNNQNIVRLHNFWGNNQNIARFRNCWWNSQNTVSFHYFLGNNQYIARFQNCWWNSQNIAGFHNFWGNNQNIARFQNCWENNQNIARFYNFWGLDDWARVALALYCNVFIVEHSFIVFRIFNNKQSGSMKLWGEMVVITKMCAVKNPNIQNVL